MAKRNLVKGITVEIGGSTVKLGKAITDSNKKTKDLQNELREVNRLLKFDPTNANLINQKLEITKKTLEEEKEKVKLLENSVEALNKAFEEGKASEEQVRAVTRELEGSREKVKYLTKEVKNFGSVTAQQMSVAGQKIETAGNKAKDAGQKMIGASMATGIALGAMAKEGMDVESAWASVLKTVPDATEQLRDDLLEVSQRTASSVETIFETAANAGQLGIASNNIAKFTETMIQMGDSTNLSSEEAAVAIAQFYNIVGEDMDTVDKFGSTVVHLGNNFPTFEDSIVGYANLIAGTGHAVGMSTQDILGYSTALGSLGIAQERGASSITTVLSKIDRAVSTNGKTLGGWASAAGMSVEEFKESWQKDASGTFQALVNGMNKSTKEGKNLNVMLKDLGVNNIRESDTMRRLVSGCETLNDALKTSKEAWDVNKALQEEAGKRYNTTASKVQQLKNMLSILSDDIMQKLKPAVDGVIEVMKEVILRFAEAPTWLQMSALAIAVVVAAIGPLLIVFGALTASIGSIMTQAPLMKAALVKAGVAIKTAFTPLPVLFTKVGAAIKTAFASIGKVPILIVITALVAALVYLKKTGTDFKTFWGNLWNKITEVAGKAVNMLETFFTDMLPRIVETIKSKSGEIASTIVKVFNTAIEMLPGIVTSLLVTLKDILMSLIQSLSTLLPYVIDGALVLFMGIVTALSMVIKPLLSEIPGLVTTIVTLLTKAAPILLDGAVQLLMAIVDAIPLIIPPLIGSLSGIISTLLEGIMVAMPVLVSGVVMLLTAIADALPAVINNILPMLPDIINALVAGLIALAPVLVKGVWELLKGLLVAVWEIGKSLVITIVDIVKGIGSRLKEHFGVFKAIGADFINGIREGVKSKIENFILSIVSIKDRVVDAFKGMSDESSGLLGKFPKTFQLVAHNISNILKSLGTIFSTIFSHIKVVVSSAIAIIKAIFTGDFGAIPGIIKGYLSSLFSSWKNILNSIVTLVINWVALVVNFFKGLWVVAKDVVPKVLDAVINFFKKLPGRISNAISNAIANVKAWAKNVGAALKNGVTTAINATVNFFKKLPGRIKSAISSAITNVKKWAGDLVSAVKTTVPKVVNSVVNGLKNLPSKVKSVGGDLVAGLWNGINNKVEWIYSKITGFKDSVVSRFKDAFGIKSPSRVMRDEVGKDIAEGVIAGIEAKKSKLKKSAEEAASLVVKSVKNSKGNSEKSFRQLSELYVTYGKRNIKALNEANKISVGYEIRFWNQMIKETKKGSIGYKRAQAELAKARDKQEMQIYEAAKSKITSLVKNNKVSVVDEVTFWKTIKSEIRKGTKAYEKASDALAKAKNKVNSETFKNEKLRIDTLAKANKITLNQEVQLWKNLRDALRKGSTEYAKANKEMLATKAELVKNTAKLNESYKKDTNKVKTDLIKGVQEIVKAYNEEVANRRDSILSSMSLFDPAKIDLTVKKKTLTENLKSQVSALTEWDKALDKLSKRKGAKNSGLLGELQEMGVSSLTTIQEFNKMSDKEFAQYIKLYKQKTAIATERAEAENADLKKKSEAQIKNLIKSANTSLNKLEATYKTNLKKLGVTTSDTSKKIGKDIVKGLQKGISSENANFKKYLTKFFKSIVSTGKDALKIKSPSRVFADVIGKQIPAGIAKGVVDNAKVAIKAVSDMSNGLVGNALNLNTATLGRQLSNTFGDQGININNLADLIIEYGEKIVAASDKQIVLDTGTLVGETAPKMDSRLANMQLLRTRGV